VAKVNQSRAVIRIVETDGDLLRTVEATPGAVGLVDVYAINSAVKVLRIDGNYPLTSGMLSRAIRLTLSNYSSDIRLS